jgi:hypothetical protein
MEVRMSALEQEILDKLKLLDRPARQRVLDVLSRSLTSPFDWDAWLREADRLRAEVDADPNNNHSISVLDLLEELRDEES